ncbi:MAG: flavodoxin-dependent (E)-4-hydroxy-3-methylbut-2-enyl-diphosphate synthase [Atribacterota bacterium]
MKEGIKRRKSRVAEIDKLKIGGDYPISVQSMTNCDVKNIEHTINQIKKLEAAGCDLVRIAFPDTDSCHLIPIIKKSTNIPIMADIHFNHLIALESIKYNIDGIRINPGNIRKEIYLSKVVKEAQKKNIMIRFGVNAGSLDKSIMEKYHEPNYKAMIEETERLINFIEKINYSNIVLSIKSSNVLDTIMANDIIAEKCDYPLHIGITEAGFDRSGIIKSSVGIGILLYKGIGDTIRVSLSGDPEEEVITGYNILNTLEIRKRGINIIACPTCGRCQVDIHNIGKQIEKNLKDIKYSFTVAIMGCIVNGPGEAKNADAGIAFNKEEGMVYKKGQLIGRYNIDESIKKLLIEIRQMSKKKRN